MKYIASVLLLLTGMALAEPGQKRIAIAITQGLYDSKRNAVRNAVGDLWFSGTNTLTEAQKDWADSGWLDLRLISNTNKIVKVYWVTQKQVRRNVDAATIAKWKQWLDNNPAADAITTHGNEKDMMEHWGLTNINEEVDSDE